MTSFILARAFCGLGAGGMMAMGSIITSDLVPIEIRGVYQSYINIIFGAGSSLGAALGGAVADNLGWRWEFGIQVPMLLLCLVISQFTIPRKLGLGRGVEKKTLWEAMKMFDFKGSLLLTSSVTFLILGLVCGISFCSGTSADRNRTSVETSSRGRIHSSLHLWLYLEYALRLSCTWSREFRFQSCPLVF
jgi:MFS family permease